jgi:hypothetical protein
MMAMAENEETQRRGIVMINYLNEGIAKFDRELFTQAPRTIAWLPVRVCSLHFCTNNPFIRTAFSLLAKGMEQDRRARLRIHDGV